MANILLVAFAIFLRVHAQPSYNLTVSFSPSNLDTCAANGSAEAITFTTGSIPPTYQCFNLDELFNSSATTEIGSRTSQSPGSSTPYESIAWRLYNKGAYDAQTNYSQFSYYQQNLTSPAEGQDASRILEVFSDRNCAQSGPSNESVYPIVGWTCQSSDDGDCFRLPYNIASFLVGSASDVNSQNGKCWTASAGMAAGLKGHVSTLLLLGLPMAATLAWLW